MAKYSDGKEDSLDIPKSSVVVLESRYLAKNSDGELIETGEDLLRRVAWDSLTNTEYSAPLPLFFLL